MPMKIERSEDTPVAEVPEMARLMKDAGEAVNMIYRLEGSWSENGWIGAQMRNEFGYGADCQYIDPKYFDKDRWIEILRSNLDGGNPVIYCGKNEAEGHTFIIDGYNSEGYHVNWGWDGYCNGYFPLDALAPNEYQDFSNCSGMVVNIEPNKTGNKYSDIFVDNGHLGGTIATDGLPMNISVNDVKKGEKFDVSLVSLAFPHGLVGKIGLALVSEKEEIKEILSSSHLDWVDACSGTHDFSGNVVTKDIDPTDRLQVVAKHDTEEEFKLVLGTMERSSYLPVTGNTPIFSRVDIDVEAGINFIFGPSFDSEQVSYTGESSRNVLKWQYQIYNAEPEQALKDQAIILKLTSSSGNQDYNRSSSERIYDSFMYADDYYEITVRIVDLLDKSIDMATAGTLEETVSPEEAICVGSLTIAGSINQKDLSYINKNFSSIKKLDLGKANIEELVYEDGRQANANTLYRQCISGSDLFDLNTLILPETLEVLEDYSLCGFNKVNSITIPAGVKTIGKSAFYYCLFFNSVCALNPEPVAIDKTVFEPNVLDNAILYVPEGSGDKYRQAPVWQDFKEIVEGPMPSGVKETFSELSGVEVYDLNGRIVNKSLDGLNPGIYVIRQGNDVKKVVIR